MFVTHFCPFVESEHDAYRQYAALNPYFVNDLSDFYSSLKSPPSLWIHGHTHKKMDYMHEKTRVVANPIGYCGEGQRRPPFIPLCVEV